MNFFVCLVRLNGGPVTPEDRRTVTARLASRGLDEGSRWEEAGSLCALVRRPGGHGPRLARVGSLVGVGDVRLDNPEEISRRLADQPQPANHLELTLRAIQARGADSAAELLGDFACVAWDAGARRLVAIRDVFGVKPLFYSKLAPDLLAFSSHASLLGTPDEISEEYVTRYFVRTISEEATIFASVDPMPAAHTLSVTDGRWSMRRYWSADRFDIDPTLSGSEAAEEFRRLFAEAVRHRLAGEGPAWSELSGGLDTSAVVSMASWLHRSGAVDRGIEGTVTYADSLGAGNESEFVDAVVEATGVRNEQIHDSWPWKDDGVGPMPTEIPGPVTMFWSRDRKRNGTLRDAGAEALLSGIGGDHLLEGNLRFFADRLAAGSFRSVSREMAHWAALQRVSFWKFGFQTALLPLLPAAARSHFASKSRNLRIPDWVADAFRKRSDMDSYLRRTTAPSLPEGSLPRYRSGNIEHVNFLARTLPRPQPSVSYERRYPFLYRPLVELTLRLLPELKVHPLGRKVVLREALRGVLPELVRARLGKGGVGTRMLWALNHEHRLIERMLRDPILAQMGYVDAARLRKAYEVARNGTERLTVPIFTTLALETWLLVEHGRWPRLEGVDHPQPVPNHKERKNHDSYQAIPEAAVPEACSH